MYKLVYIVIVHAAIAILYTRKKSINSGLGRGTRHFLYYKKRIMAYQMLAHKNPQSPSATIVTNS